MVTAMPAVSQVVIGYAVLMRRFAHPDLFAHVPDPPPASPEPVSELTQLLAELRTAETLPWPDAAATMAVERRALGLARLAGAEGERLTAAIMKETERLLSAAER